MKWVTTIFLLLFSLPGACQNATFLRLYNTGGYKIAKGNFLNTTDTSLVLLDGKSPLEIPISEIAVIRRQRTLFHRIAITSLKVVTGVVLVGAALYALSHNKTNHINSHKRKTKEDGFAKRGSRQKQPNSYQIRGDTELWKKQRLLLHQLQ